MRGDRAGEEGVEGGGREGGGERGRREGKEGAGKREGEELEREQVEGEARERRDRESGRRGGHSPSQLLCSSVHLTDVFSAPTLGHTEKISQRGTKKQMIKINPTVTWPFGRNSRGFAEPSHCGKCFASPLCRAGQDTGPKEAPPWAGKTGDPELPPDSTDSLWDTTRTFAP